MEKISVKAARQAAAIGHKCSSKAGSAPAATARAASASSKSTTARRSPTCKSSPTARCPTTKPKSSTSPPAAASPIEGEVKASGGKGQATEVLAKKLTVLGTADPEAYPLQKKQHSLEKLREWAHLRPRTNTFGAVTRVRNCVSRSIHNFFQEDGFLYIHTPIITASDCEGAGAMFRVTTLDLEKLPRDGGEDQPRARLLRQAGLSHRQRPARRRNLRLRARQDLHLRPDVPRREQQHLAAPRRVLDGRARDGLLRADRQHGPGRAVPQADLQGRARRSAPRTWPSSTSTTTRRRSRRCKKSSPATSAACPTPKPSRSWKSAARNSSSR